MQVQPDGDRQNLSELHQEAEELYKAISRDALTFEAAMLVREIRLQLESALQRKLPDEVLRELAHQANAEAVYWYRYMQGLE